MSGESNLPKRAYDASTREAGAERTRAAILRAAKQLFEQYGWAGTTLRAVAADAAVSQKSVEAIYKTKAGLLQATIDYAMRGDTELYPDAATPRSPRNGNRHRRTNDA